MCAGSASTPIKVIVIVITGQWRQYIGFRPNVGQSIEITSKSLNCWLMLSMTTETGTVGGRCKRVKVDGEWVVFVAFLFDKVTCMLCGRLISIQMLEKMTTTEAEAVSAALFMMMIWCVAFIDQPGLDTTTVARDPTCLPHHPRTPLMVCILYTMMNVLASPIEPCAAKSCPFYFYTMLHVLPRLIFLYITDYISTFFRHFGRHYICGIYSYCYHFNESIIENIYALYTDYIHSKYGKTVSWRREHWVHRYPLFLINIR